MSTAAASPSAATQRMLEGPVFSTLLRLATPNVLGLLANTIVIGFDGYIVGRIGADALAGVALVLPLAMLMLHMSAGSLGGSTTAVVARALGAGNVGEATCLARHAVLLGLLASALFALVGTSATVYSAIGGKGEALQQATEYASVLFGGAVAIWLANVLAGVARGTGQMGAAAFALLGSTSVHLVMCPLLVFGGGPSPAFGVAGAAASTVLINGLAALGLLWWLSRRNSPVQVIGSGWRLSLDAFRRVLKIALPSALGPLLSNASIGTATSYVATFGGLAIAGYGIAARLEYILVPIAFGFGGALTAMVGANLGAQQVARAKRVAWVGALMVCIITGAIGVWAALLPHVWMGLFTQDAAVMQAGSNYLRIVGGSYGFFGLSMALFFASQGAGRLFWPLLASAARLLVVLVGGAVVLRVYGSQPEALYLVVAGSLMVTGITMAAATRAADWSTTAALPR